MSARSLIQWSHGTAWLEKCRTRSQSIDDHSGGRTTISRWRIGFAAYLTSHSHYRAGVYSAPDIWAEIFDTGTAASIPNTYEWTYESFTSSLTHHPAGWCLSGTSTCARFFGGVTNSSAYALMWQWPGGGGSYNGHGDFDQIDASRTHKAGRGSMAWVSAGHGGPFAAPRRDGPTAAVAGAAGTPGSSSDRAPGRGSADAARGS